MDASAVVTPPYLGRPLRLEPFRALHLDPRRVGDPASARVFSRPQRSAAARIAQWRERGQLRQDPTPALYLHEFSAGGLLVRGLVGALDLTRRAVTADQRAVLPHEGIHPNQADELADRMIELGVNPAPIMLVHRAPESARAALQAVTSGAPEREFTDRVEQHHRVWPIRDPEVLAVLTEAIAGSRALIADGHHRYAAYLRMQQRAPGAATDRGLAMLIDHDDTPLFLGPIHRLLSGVRMADIEAAARAAQVGFERLDHGRAIDALAPDTMVATDGHSWTALRLPAHTTRAAVQLLHQDLLPALPRGPRRVSYHHDVEAALRSARRGANCVAVLLPAPEARQVLELATAGELLPEKATSFHPKPGFGVLIRSLHDE